MCSEWRSTQKEFKTVLWDSCSKNGVVGKIKTIASDVPERERSEALKQVFETN